MRLFRSFRRHRRKLTVAAGLLLAGEPALAHNPNAVANTTPASIVAEEPDARPLRLGSGSIRVHDGTIDPRDRDHPLIGQLLAIFGTRIDFARDLHADNRYRILYEEPATDVLPSATDFAASRVIAAQLVNAGRTHEAIWFQAPGRAGAWFDPNDRVWAVLSMPLEFARTTSGFAMRRHPITKTMRLHAGVDFAAPYGTPVRSVDAGMVTFAGIQDGFGKVVYVQHDDGRRTTVYAHLSRIDVRSGHAIEQGASIGAVGSTGLSTGPHLHFEVREDGKPVDPMSLAYAGDAHSPDSRAQFQARVRAFRAQLANEAKAAR